MPKTTTHLIVAPKRARRPNRPSVGTDRVNEHKKRQRKLLRERDQFTHCGGITHCSKCPPKRWRGDALRFCDECASINAARHKNGLLRPNDGDEPHANNIINPEILGSYRGQSQSLRYRHGPPLTPVVVLTVRRLGGGWRQGVVRLESRDIFIGPKTRSHEAAWAYAEARAKAVRAGLEITHG